MIYYLADDARYYLKMARLVSDSKEDEAAARASKAVTNGDVWQQFIATPAEAGAFVHRIISPTL